MILRLADRLRATPYALPVLGILAVAAYLCLVNLDYAALWHDEAPAALIGRNLLQRGDITGWDGRNLVGGTNGRTLNAELRDVLPPLTYVLNAAGMAVFGVNETGARIVHALIGILTLGLLYLLLRQHLAQHPRLILFCLLFAVWSPQLLLYFRQSRYFAFMACALIAAFYLYERWWRSGSVVDLGVLTLVALLAFFNHYNGGAATMLALAAWHLIFRARATTPRQWLALAGAGMVVVAVGTAYLGWLGVIGGERSGWAEFAGFAQVAERPETPPSLPFRVLPRIAIYTRELFTADWISWPVFLWFVAMLLVLLRRHRSSAAPAEGALRGVDEQRAPRGAPGNPAAQGLPAATGCDPLIMVARITLMGALFALFSAALSVQPVWRLVDPRADLRYYMGALPLLLALKGLFAEWAWRRARLAGAAVALVLLLSSAGAWPFNLVNYHTGEPTLGLHLLQFVREIHRPYRDSIREVSGYLLQHAAQDDLVYVPGFADREALAFAAGDRVLFCCVLDEDTPLPPATVASLGPQLMTEGTTPDWIILFGRLSEEYLDRVETRYAMVAQPNVYFYPTQRPEINSHTFSPLPAGQQGVHILQRRAEYELHRAARALLMQERFEEALATYRQALTLDPDYVPAHAGSGEALFHLARYEEALEALARAVALQPRAALAGARLRLMGLAEQELGHPEAAAGHYEMALKLDPDDTEALDRLALVRYHQQRYAEALELYRRLAAIKPDGAQIHANVGAALYFLGRVDEAMASFEHALALDPELETARAALARIGKTTPTP